MNKFFIRMVALLLVPCLITDPILASSFFKSFAVWDVATPHENLFAEQAFVSRLIVSPLKSFSKRLRSESIRSLKSATPSEKHQPLTTPLAMEGDPYLETVQDWIKTGRGKALPHSVDSSRFEFHYYQKSALASSSEHFLSVSHAGNDIANLHFNIDTEKLRPEAYMYDLLSPEIDVDPDYQERGIGSSLIGFAMRIAILKGVPLFEALETTSAGAALFESLGFREEKDDRGFFMHRFNLGKVMSWRDLPNISIGARPSPIMLIRLAKKYAWLLVVLGVGGMLGLPTEAGAAPLFGTTMFDPTLPVPWHSWAWLEGMSVIVGLGLRVPPGVTPEPNNRTRAEALRQLIEENKSEVTRRKQRASGENLSTALVAWAFIKVKDHKRIRRISRDELCQFVDLTDGPVLIAIRVLFSNVLIRESSPFGKGKFRTVFYEAVDVERLREIASGNLRVQEKKNDPGPKPTGASSLSRSARVGLTKKSAWLLPLAVWLGLSVAGVEAAGPVMRVSDFSAAPARVQRPTAREQYLARLRKEGARDIETVDQVRKVVEFFEEFDSWKSGIGGSNKRMELKNDIRRLQIINTLEVDLSEQGSIGVFYPVEGERVQIFRADLVPRSSNYASHPSVQILYDEKNDTLSIVAGIYFQILRGYEKVKIDNQELNAPTFQIETPGIILSAPPRQGASRFLRSPWGAAVIWPMLLGSAVGLTAAVAEAAQPSMIWRSPLESLHVVARNLLGDLGMDNEGAFIIERGIPFARRSA